MALSDGDKQPFAFLRLPADIRYIIYEYTLTLSPIDCRKIWREKYASNKIEDERRERPSLQLLLTSKQIHCEASHILFRLGRFCIDIDLMNKYNSPDQCALEMAYSKSVKRIRHILIRIIWYGFLEWDNMLSSELSLFCDALPILTNLQTVGIRFLCLSKYVRGDEAYKPCTKAGFSRILQPLKDFHAKHLDLRFEIREEDPYWKPKPPVRDSNRSSREKHMPANGTKDTKWMKVWRLVGRELVEKALHKNT